MSALIKAQSSHVARAFAPAAARSPAPNGEAPLAAEPAEDPRIALLAAEIASLKKELEAARVASAAAVEKALDEGRREGQAAAQRDDEKRLAALDEGLAAALGAWDSRLAELEGLAALLSRTALSQLFDRPESYADLVAAAVARQMRQLRRETVIAVRVSAADFPDSAGLQAFAAAASTGSLPIVTSSDLAAGECRIDLQLGHIDVGPKTQWAKLSALLEDCVAGDSA